MATGTETKTADVKPIGKAGINHVAMVDEMKDLGWNAKENTDGSGYSAHEINGDRTIGPAKRIDALLTQVKLASGKPVANGNGKVHKVAAPAPTQRPPVEANVETRTGTQPILTGTEDAVFSDMKALGVDYRKTTMEILRLQKIQATMGEQLREMMDKFQDELTVKLNSNGLNDLSFTVEVEGEAVEVLLEAKETKSLKTRKAD